MNYKRKRQVMEVIKQLQQQLDTLSLIEKSLSEQSQRTNEVDELVTGIDEKSSDLFGKCNVILKKKKEQQNTLEAINKEIRYYDAFDELARAISNPKSIDFYSAQFKNVYLEISDCIDYFQMKKTDSVCYNYFLRYQQLKSKALNYLSVFVKKQIDVMHQSCKTLPVLPLSQFTTSTLYESQVSANFSTLIDILKLKNGILESSYLDECVKHYIAIRKALLLPYVSKLLTTLEQINPNASVVTREGGIYLFTIFYKEGKLFRSLFSQDSQALKVVLGEVFEVYSTYVSTLCYSCHDLGVLCTALTYLRDEQILYRLPHSKLVALPEYAPFQACVETLISLISERLLHVSLLLVNTLIANYSPQTSDLDYPNIFKTSSISDLPFRLVLYPPTANTLTLLSNLHFALDPKPFSEVASTAVISCVDAVLRASKMVCPDKQFDGKLFAIRNLCILRDQIVPFTCVDDSLRKVESAIQELSGEVCNEILKILCPTGVESLRKIGEKLDGVDSQILQEVNTSIPRVKDILLLFNVYLHQVHQKELIEIFKARILYFSHKLAVILRKEEFEKQFVEGVSVVFTE
ncbi:hypothetical protein EIN_381480 [Entamoeba invadens IP1]|uniref:Conserved oligomeric Golgi complex subunit 3 n=1 Tax=Entamoeba invadens IP1 TaxID=370355 RepID=A0A0A1UEG2_ENTIV|nr:hypothetical protein EIN_381480 [Entamoeba invadens IP1]ELP92181.1 hypothetical protein EIN_381480 [Entamoeba invadens IP1]|eukprot:XP_004258952.1 hypothetical protein EIN_381480 [Entamoeba invadens IP1]